MFTSWSRVRGRQGVRRIGWNRLSLHKLEERTAPAQLIVTSAADDGSAGTLRSIVAIANTNKQADTITFDPSVTNIQLVSGQITISEANNLLIDGGGTVTISGAAAASATNRIFNLTATGTPTIELKGLTLTKGNLSSGSGGAVTMTAQTLVLNDSTLTFNKAANGGAVACVTSSGGNINIVESQFSDNASAYDGGAVYYYGRAKIQINTSTWENNSAANGGALYVGRDSVVTVEQCTFTTNKTTYTYNGGAIYQEGKGSLTINRCTFSKNTGYEGGGVHLDGYSGDIEAVITDSTWLENSATGYGGGLQVQGSASVTVSGCTFANNTGYRGGAIATYTLYDPVILAMSNCTLTGNNATFGGAVYSDGRTDSGTVLRILNCTIVKNQASNTGGGFYLESKSSSFLIHSSIVTINKAPSPADIYVSAAATIHGNYNLYGQLGTGIALPGTSSVVNQFNPGLIALGDFGGPTLTMGLAYNSVAVDKGNNLFALPTDQRGLPRESPAGFPDVGAVEGIELVPFISSHTTISNITKAGGTAIDVTVVYDAPTGIDSTTIDGNDLIVTGRLPMQAINVSSIVTSGNQVTANYKIVPPGGSWDAFDTGSYTIGVAPNQVFDLATPTQSIVPNDLTSFQVIITGSFVVDSVGDVVDGNYLPGEFSLREAFEIANVNATTRDTITFDSKLFSSQQTIELTAELPIATQIVINGPGSNLLTLSGQNTNRIFNATGSGATTLTGLTLANGYSGDDGGAINAGQALTITNCQFIGNSAARDGGAIFTSALLTVTGAKFAENSAGGNGGAICFYNTLNSLTIIECILDSNVAAVNGGAIFMPYDNAVFTRSSLSNNDALNGGGVYFATWYSFAGPTINNCTFSGNSAVQFGGALHLPNTPYSRTIRNCTLTNNSAGLAGGAIFRGTNTGSVNLQSTIVAGNQAIIGPDLFFDVPTEITADNSLIGITDSGNFSVTGTGNLVGTKAAPLDAKLGPLANNGGPTLTHALLPGSPAINAGNNANKLTTDQRGTGFARVVGGQADIGSFEVQTPPPRVLAVHVNDGSAQRSMVTSFKVTFSEPVSFPNGIGIALELQRIGPGTPTGLVNINAVQTGNDVLVTFAGGGAVQLDPGNSLKDGHYSLTIHADQVIGIGGQLDGDGKGTTGDDYVFATRRLFGDSTGDGIVSAVDFNAFRLAYATPNVAFDFDNDGVVSAGDFFQFRLRYGVVI